jgi:beta-lactamase regulating signal transducer with metallopeptidase domain
VSPTSAIATPSAGAQDVIAESDATGTSSVTTPPNANLLLLIGILAVIVAFAVLAYLFRQKSGDTPR